MDERAVSLYREPDAARPDRSERRTAVLFFMFFFCLGSLYVVGFTATETLFLSNYGQHELARFLPYLYISNAICLAIVTWIYRLFLDKVKVVRVIILNGVLSAVILLLFHRAISNGGVNGIYFALILYFTVYFDFTATTFYAYLGNYFELHQARRLYSFICSGTACANLLSGFFVGFILEYIPLADLLYLCAILAAASAAVAGFIARNCSPKAALLNEEAQATSKIAPAAEKVHMRYLVILSIVIALSVFSLITLNYQLLSTASAALDEMQLASFLSRFYGYAGFALFASQLLLTNWVVKRFGVIRSTFILPGIMLAGVLVMLFSGAPYLTIVAATFFLAMVLDETVWVVCKELLYLPLPDKLRLISQAIGYGMLGSVGKVLSGISLLLLAAIFAPPPYYAAALALALVAWIGLLFLLSTRYKRVMLATLKRWRAGEREQQYGAESWPSLHTERIALAMMDGDKPPSSVAHIYALMNDPSCDATGRCACLHHLGDIGGKEAEHVIFDKIRHARGVELLAAVQAAYLLLETNRMSRTYMENIRICRAHVFDQAGALLHMHRFTALPRTKSFTDSVYLYIGVMLILLGIEHGARELPGVNPASLSDRTRRYNLLEVMDAILPHGEFLAFKRVLTALDEQDLVT